MCDIVNPYRLSPDEMQIAINNANFRQTSKDAVEVPDRKYSKESGVFLHTVGCIAETGIGGMLRQKPHQLSTVRGDGGHVDYIHLELPLSVKGRHRGVYLIIPPWQWPPRCVQIACLVENDLVIPTGWAFPEEIEQWVAEHGKINLGHGPSFCMHMTALRPMRLLQKAFEIREKRGHW